MNCFIKTNSANNDSLLKEAKGLLTLEKAIQEYAITELHTPKIHSVHETKLELDKITTSKATAQQMQTLGVGLAKLHKIEFTNFGLSYDNYIGLNPQKNVLSNDWGEFFCDMRLMFQVERIIDDRIRKLFKKILVNKRFSLIAYLNDCNESPSLVHGDLWAGNVLFDKTKIYLIDPAIYYGHREVDIAMSELFGGFTQVFYDSYNEAFPLDSYYHERKVIYNLYHYLNHYNLFGDSYLHSCEEAFNFIERL